MSINWNPAVEEMAASLLIGGMSAEEVAAELDLCPAMFRELLAECRDDARDCGDADLFDSQED
jgi:hypothetical protein